MAIETDDGDLLELLAREDDEIQSLFEAYQGPEASEDHTVRAAIGKELIDRLSTHDAVKEELVHTLAREMDRQDLADALDAHSRERKAVLAELDEISAGVTPRDVHQSRGQRFDELMVQLGELTRSHLGHERDEVVPAIRQAVDPAELARRAAEVEGARRRAPSHPVPDAPLAHERGAVAKTLKAAFDRVRDVPDTSHQRPRPNG